MTRRFLLLLTLAAPAPASVVLGCSITPCYYGVWPYDGQTDVPVDSVVTFRASGVEPDMPAVRPGLRLFERDSGEPVEFDVEVVAGEVRLVPVEPLRQDTWFVAIGLDEEQIANAHWGGSMGREATRVEFYTGSDPTLITAIRSGDEVVLVLSQPFDVDDVILRDAEGNVVPGTVGSALEPHLIPVSDDGLAREVELGGVTLGVFDTWEAWEAIEWFRSEPVCTDLQLGSPGSWPDQTTDTGGYR